MKNKEKLECNASALQQATAWLPSGCHFREDILPYFNIVQ